MKYLKERRYEVKVLLLDRDPDRRDAVVSALQEVGHSVEVATVLPTARACCRFDRILLVNPSPDLADFVEGESEIEIVYIPTDADPAETILGVLAS